MHHHYFLLLQPKIEVKLNIKTSFLPQVDTSFTHYYEASHLVTLGQIFYSRGRPLENSRGRPVDFTGRPLNSTGRPLEFSRGRPVKFFIALLDEIGNSKSFEANLQNSSGRPVGFLEDVQ